MQVSKDQEKTTLADKIVWLLFCATCLQLAFLKPYVILIPGERANVFSGLLCAVTLLAALLIAKRRSVKATAPEALISIALLSLAVISGLFSLTPWSSSIRVFVSMASGIGGFWCARILLNTPSRQKTFVWFCAGILLGMLVLGVWGYQVSKFINYFLYSNPHPMVHVLFLLVFSALALIFRRKPLTLVLGVLLAVFTYIVLYLGTVEVEGAVLIPLAVIFAVAVLGSFLRNSWPTLLILLLVISGITAHYIAYVSRENFSGPDYQVYRFESYPFSWHITQKYPFLGIGLRAPRDEFLTDYEIRHPRLSRERFGQEVREGVTAENAFLTLMTGLGLPFLILYCTALIVLLTRLVRAVLRPPPEMTFHPLVLLIPITGSLIHSLTTDNFMIPQVCWFFHILLGLIPMHAAPSTAPETTRQSVGLRIAAAIGVLILGSFVGTHQAFSPDNLPSVDISSYLKKIPVVASFYYADPKLASGDKTGAPVVSEVVGPVRNETAGVEQAQTKVRPEEEQIKQDSAAGDLVVNIQNYKGSEFKWGLAVILDNSDTMAKEGPPWQPSRLRAAVDFIARVGNAIPHASKMSVRSFVGEVSGKKGGREVPFRVSRVLYGWSDSPFTGLEALGQVDSGEGNNVCAASVRAAETGIAEIGDLAPRILLITDGMTECSIDGLLEAIDKSKLDEKVRVDALAIGMKRPTQEAYARLAQLTDGAFLTLDRPSDINAMAASYSETLKTLRPKRIQVVGRKSSHWMLPSEKLNLPPGSYSVTMPNIEGLNPSMRVIKDIKIESGRATALNVFIEEGRPVIQPIAGPQ